MAKNTEDINPGGINGSGKGVVNTNSADFISLREAVKEHAKKQTPEDQIRYKLLSLKLQMTTYVSEENPSVHISVGDFLKQHLKAIKIKNKEFAKYVEIEESNLSSMIRGRRKINIDFALKLGQLFKVNPNLWLLIQSKNEFLNIDREKKLSYRKYKLDDLLKKTG